MTTTCLKTLTTHLISCTRQGPQELTQLPSEAASQLTPCALQVCDVKHWYCRLDAAVICGSPMASSSIGSSNGSTTVHGNQAGLDLQEQQQDHQCQMCYDLPGGSWPLWADAPYMYTYKKLAMWSWLRAVKCTTHITAACCRHGSDVTTPVTSSHSNSHRRGSATHKSPLLCSPGCSPAAQTPR